MEKTKGDGLKKSRKKLGLRTRRLSRSQTKKLAKSKRLSGAWRLTGRSFKTFFSNWRLLGGISLVYGALSVLLAQSSANLTDLELEETGGALEEAATEFNSLLGGFGASDSMMQLILVIFVFLALIWALRRVNTGEPTSIKQSYYLAMAPLVPFLLLLTLLFVQLIPMLIASAGLQFALGSGVSSSAAEAGIWIVIFILAAWWSFYMICRTYVALFIVTLPGMTPLQARRKAKELVLGRRLSISLKLVFLPLFVILLMAVVMIPVIMLLPVIASPVFVLLSPLLTCYSVIYLFNLYQEIIK